MLRRVMLLGEMGEKYGAKHMLDVNSVGEALRAINANNPGFMRSIKKEENYNVCVGDFNDKIDDSVGENIYQVFLDDSSNFQCLTFQTKDIPTYIGNFNSSVDHIIISGDTRDEYQGGYIQVLRIDEAFSNYVNYISDHRPVLARFFVF